MRSQKGRRPPSQPANEGNRTHRHGLGRKVFAGLGRTGCIALLVLIAVVAVVVGMSVSGRDQADEDVKISSCDTDSETGRASAELRITNHSSARSDYVVDVVFDDARGIQVDEGTGATKELAHGEVAETAVRGRERIRGVVTCKVASWTRYSDN